MPVLKPKYRGILRDYLIGWFVASLVWELLRNVGQPESLASELTFSMRVIVFIITWLSQGLFFGLLDIFIERYIFGRVRFIKLLLSALALQLAVMMALIVLLFYIFKAMDLANLPETLAEFIQLPVIPIALVYAMIVNFCISVVVYINMMLGNGNLLRLIRGEFYTPKADIRIFMFLDLRGSTTIAERLGHIRYSRLIQDCFYDLAVVHDYKAEIYQYVGDEAVLVWPANIGYNAINCVKAFFAFQNRIKERAAIYKSRYDIIPEFKAGLNIGEVTIAEVGELKREIAYHGDTINTAARLEASCNRLNADLLVSENLLKQLELEPWLKSDLKGEIQLRGKQSTVNIYAIEKVTGSGIKGIG